MKKLNTQQRIKKIQREFEDMVFRPKKWDVSRFRLTANAESLDGILDMFEIKLKDLSQQISPIKKLYWRRNPVITKIEMYDNSKRFMLSARIVVVHQPQKRMRKNVKILEQTHCFPVDMCGELRVPNIVKKKK